MTADPLEVQRLESVRAAFDSVAGEYDGDLGNNEVIQRFRAELWKEVESRVPRGSSLLDIGCGTGLDVAHFASIGYEVTGADWSPDMVARTARRIDDLGLQTVAKSVLVGAHELDAFKGNAFDGIYSNLGPLNCAPDLGSTARMCADALKPGGHLVVSVIGRVCPWEILYYSARGSLQRARARFSNGPVPVPLNGQTVWTKYYTPNQFFKPFARQFTLKSCRGLGLLAPPPYLIGAWRRAQGICATAAGVDDRIGRWPGLRNAGDHFLMVMNRCE